MFVGTAQRLMCADEHRLAALSSEPWSRKPCLTAMQLLVGRDLRELTKRLVSSHHP